MQWPVPNLCCHQFCCKIHRAFFFSFAGRKPKKGVKPPDYINYCHNTCSKMLWLEMSKSASGLYCIGFFDGCQPKAHVKILFSLRQFLVEIGSADVVLPEWIHSKLITQSPSLASQKKIDISCCAIISEATQSYTSFTEVQSFLGLWLLSTCPKLFFYLL